MVDLEIDDWDPDELEWVDFEPSTAPPPVNEDGTINDGWPKFKVDDWGPNMQHEDVNTLDFDISDMRHVFSLFFTETIVHKMITATNAYGRLYVKGWKKDLDVPEFHAFLGIILFLCFIGYPSRKELFGLGHCRNDYVRSIMQRDRFEQLLKAWHYEDYSQYSADEILHHKAEDPFWPVDALCIDLASRFQALYTHGQSMDVDEQCIPWKGRHKCRCYNKDKPKKRFLKLYALNDSRSKYQYDFYPYRGKAEKRPPGVSATAAPVMYLLRHLLLHFKEYILATDNWYTSFEVLKFCIIVGIHFLGTVQVKRKGIPLSFKTNHGERQTHERGDYITKHTVYLQEVIYFTTWVDNKVVNMLHTMPSYQGSCTRRIKEIAEDRVNHRWNLAEVDQPTIIPQYNRTMGGTDGIDQGLEDYRPYLKTRSWVTRFLTHLLNVAEMNTYIWLLEALDKKDLQPARPLTHKRFSLLLKEHLVHAELQKRELQNGHIKEISQSKVKWNKDHSRLRDRHFPTEVELTEDQKGAGKIQSVCTMEEFAEGMKRKHKYKRSTCIMCSSLVNVQCIQCKVFLCLKTKPGVPNCWFTFHSESNILTESIVEEEIEEEDDELTGMHLRSRVLK